MKDIPSYVSFLANIVVIAGAVPVFFWLKNRSFEKKRNEISDNLAVKKKIKEKLREHADGYDRKEPHDIGIRLVNWKNYPWKLDDDGYKQYLYYDTNLDKRLYHGTEFLNNTGILLEEHIWFVSTSLYLGPIGTYMVSKSDQKIDGFQEVKQRLKLVRTLQYKHIINWDFEEKIEYEPVFYIRYKYNSKRLFENDFFAQNYKDDGIKNGLYFHMRLDRRKQVNGIKSFNYNYLLARSRYLGKRTTRKDTRS